MSPAGLVYGNEKRDDVLARTVEKSLAQGHDGGAEANQDSSGTTATSGDLLALDGSGLDKSEVHVVKVHGGLDGIQSALGRGEAIAGVEGLPAVDVVDLAVELVRRPEGIVHPSVLHGMGATKNVNGIPENQWERNTHPQQSPVRGRVGEATGGRRGARGRLGSRGRRAFVAVAAAAA